MSVIVIDNFLIDFPARRAQALSGTFAPHDATGAIFPGINTNAINDFPHTSVTTFYRLTLAHDELPTFIHNDSAMARTTGILYLSDGPGGTAFWQHRDTKSYGGYDIESGIERYQTDGLDERHWLMERTVRMRENRLVLFNSALWHSPWPRFGWGDSPETGRLIQVYFFP